MNSLFDLTGKTALVTGARTGLGQGIALALAEAGADIVGLGSSDMSETREMVTGLGRSFAFIKADLTQPIDAEALISEAGTPDILVNNAGIIRRDDLLEAKIDDWDDVLNINLRAAYQLSQSFAQALNDKNTGYGRIINIASMLSYQGGIRVASYTASKHGIVGLTKALANELAPMGITVNAIAPGYMDTDNTEALRTDTVRNAEILNRIPAGRWGVPKDLATAALFLAAPASSYVTATTAPVDGGWLSR